MEQREQQLRTEIKQLLNEERVPAMSPELSEAIRRTILKVDTYSSPVVHRIHFLKTAWFRYAAAIIILLGTGAYFWFRNADEKTSIAYQQSSPRYADIHPGSNKAILSIDNKTIDLASNKASIHIGNTITYNDGERIADAGQLLQLTTPRGGQYQAVLPDGSKVWLNAASGIKFPSKFTGNKREVEISGEVYLEIAQNFKQPFSLNVNGAKIEVLGTSFNINSYRDEGVIKTTLVDGSIRINTDHQSEMLKPGQQAIVESTETKKNIQIQSANIDQVLAWKNGYFNFEGANLQAVMRQLSRWYDIEVLYKGNIPAYKFKGELDRGLSLTELLEILQHQGIQYLLKGRTLVISPKGV